MSRIHYLVCHSKRKLVAIGQGYDRLVIWTDPSQEIDRVRRFLEETMGEPIVCEAEEKVQHYDRVGFYEDPTDNGPDAYEEFE